MVTKIKELLHAGNIRRIIVKNESGHTLIEIPLAVGVCHMSQSIDRAP
jgi:hypothetical protein